MRYVSLAVVRPVPAKKTCMYRVRMSHCIGLLVIKSQAIILRLDVTAAHHDRTNGYVTTFKVLEAKATSRAGR